VISKIQWKKTKKIIVTTLKKIINQYNQLKSMNQENKQKRNQWIKVARMAFFLVLAQGYIHILIKPNLISVTQ
jgi:hypothetical protein